MTDARLNEFSRRMDGALEALRKEFGGLRTGRASAHLLDQVVFQAYGNPMPLNQVGTVNVPEPRMITVNVWDRSLVGAVEKAIRDGGLGLNPASDGQLVRVPIPELSQERRTELTKIAHKYAEQGRGERGPPGARPDPHPQPGAPHRADQDRAQICRTGARRRPQRPARRHGSAEE